MNIAIASGKGGTGKTTVATSVAYVLSEIGNKVSVFDCDVEEPNDHIFLGPENIIEEVVEVGMPELIEEKCNSCGKCSDICQFNSIFYTNGKPLFFSDICHSCRLCERICPEDAIKMVPKRIGVTKKGRVENIFIRWGVLDIGQVLTTKVIEKVLEGLEGNKRINIIDSPPGTSCSAVASVKEADIVVLVTEPTPFGLHDLDVAVRMTRQMGKKIVVIINRSDLGDNKVKEYCAKNNIRIIGEIPYIDEVAKIYSKGELIVKKIPAIRNRFLTIALNILSEAGI
ncbi:MAG: ATP-binding protein [Candidatus Muirbacterium halophilum]|nr:ATP-binding protein [Candidatus Muirbacterium halophilum]MCK9476014.1 ATP-binding protein [Candidatus Muirbacterium halophilum]